MLLTQFIRFDIESNLKQNNLTYCKYTIIGAIIGVNRLGLDGVNL